DDVELLPGDDEPEASAHAEAIEVVETAPMPETAQEMPLATPLDAPMEAPVDVPTDTPIEVPAAVQTAWGVLPSEAVAPVEAVSRGRQDIDDDIDAVDTIDVDLFPIFAEEAQELLPQLGSALRQWVQRPDNAS